MKLLSILALCSPITANAATLQLIDPQGGLISDGSTAGLARNLILNRPGETISTLTVELSISPTGGSFAFLGDLYIYLSDGERLVTLANRAGRDAGAPDGYDDDVPLSVTFADSATIDFHTYRIGITGSNTTPLSEPLIGSFQPDGRITSPSTVVTGDARTSQLSDFFGLSAERTFTLFAADLSGGAEHQIDTWTLNLETVPEPGVSLLVLFGGCTFLRRRRR